MRFEGRKFNKGRNFVNTCIDNINKQVLTIRVKYQGYKDVRQWTINLCTFPRKINKITPK